MDLSGFRDTDFFFCQAFVRKWVIDHHTVILPFLREHRQEKPSSPPVFRELVDKLWSSVLYCAILSTEHPQKEELYYGTSECDR